MLSRCDEAEVSVLTCQDAISGAAGAGQCCQCLKEFLQGKAKEETISFHNQIQL